MMRMKVMRMRIPYLGDPAAIGRAVGALYCNFITLEFKKRSQTANISVFQMNKTPSRPDKCGIKCSCGRGPAPPA